MNVHTVRSMANDMRQAVDIPGDIEHVDVPKDDTVHERIQRVLIEKVHRQTGRQKGPTEKRQGKVVTTLKGHYRISEKIGEVNGTAFGSHIGMLLQHQPTTVRKEEATIGIVRISI